MSAYFKLSDLFEDNETPITANGEVATKTWGYGTFSGFTLLSYHTPIEERILVQSKTPGIKANYDAKGNFRGLTISNYLDFGAYLVNRWQIINVDGSLIATDETGARVSGDDDLIKLFTRCGRDVITTDKQSFNVLRAVEREAPRVRIEVATKYIMFKNGTYIIDTQEFRKGDFDYPALFTVPHRYNPFRTVDPDSFALKYLECIACNRDDVVRLMQQVIGFTMCPSLAKREIPILVSNGQHGKSTFVDLLTNIMGVNNTNNESLHELGGRFGMAELRGKAFNVADDEDVSLLTPDIVRRIKILGSHGSVYCDRKGISGVNMRVYQSVIMTSNSAPRTTQRDANNGIWDRCVVVPFDADFSGENNKERDAQIFEKLQNEDVIEDFIWLGMQALKDVQNNGWRLMQTQEGREQAEEMRQQSDNVLAWMKDEFEEINGSRDLTGYSANNLYDAYTRYCGRSNTGAISNKAFTSHLASLCPGYTRQRTRINDIRPYLYNKKSASVAPRFYRKLVFEEGFGALKNSEAQAVSIYDRKTGNYVLPEQAREVELIKEE